MLKLFDASYVPESKEAKSILASFKKALANNDMQRAVKLAGKLLNGTKFDAIGLELTPSGKHKIAVNHLEMSSAIVQYDSTFRFEAAMDAAGEPWVGGDSNLKGLSFAVFGDKNFKWVNSL